MLKIGDFSKLGHVTVKTLRYYGRMGLLKPTFIDRFTSYRYYSLEQLPRLNRILALKDLGFSLDQVAELLDEEVPVEQMRGMLRRKQAELEARLAAEQNRLGRVAARLQQIEREGRVVGVDVLLKSAPPQAAAVVRTLVPAVERLPQYLDQLAGELHEWLTQTGVTSEGPCMALYSEPEYRERNIPLELAVAVPLDALGHAYAPLRSRVALRTLQAVNEMACLVHTGPLELLPQAYADLFSWIETHLYRVNGPARELYLRDPDGKGPCSQAIEVQLPVERLSTAQENGHQGKKEQNMEPKIVIKPAFNVVGMCYHGKNQNHEIPNMWGKFLPRIGEIQRINPSVSYGVCVNAEGLPEGEFEYVAGVETAEGAPIPEEMVLRRVPEKKYAVFEHIGPLAGLGQTYQNIYQSWLPQSGLQWIPGDDMEVYTDKFMGDAPESILYIYVTLQ